MSVHLEAKDGMDEWIDGWMNVSEHLEADWMDG